MTNARSRWLLVVFVLLSAMLLQGAIMWVRPFVAWADWLLLGFLMLLAFMHVETPAPE